MPEKNEFLDALQTTLLGRSGVVTSDTDELTGKIEEAISGVEKSREVSKEGISAEFALKREALQQTQATELDSALSKRRGFATNLALLGQIKESNEKSLRDLDAREKVALAAGDMEAAKTIADLTLKQVQFGVEAEQRTFQNLLSASTARIQQQQEQRLASTQSFTERTKLAELGLQYGVSIGEGDDVNSVIAKIQRTGLAGKKEGLELEKLRADIELSKAKRDEALRGGNVTLDPTSISFLTDAIEADPNRIQFLDKDASEQVLIESGKRSQPRKFEDDELRQLVRNARSQNLGYKQVLQQIASDSKIQNKERAELISREIYGIGEGKTIFSGFSGDIPKGTVPERPSREPSRIEKTLSSQNKRNKKAQEVFGQPYLALSKEEKDRINKELGL